MKTTLLFLLTFLPFLSFAQAPTDTVYIPDGHFKWALLTPDFNGYGIIDTNGDGEIEYGEAQAITHLNLFNGMLSGLAQPLSTNSTTLSQGLITDLTGIEAFINLTYLKVSYNQLDSLSLNENVALDTLYCSNNQLTYLDVSNNPNLKLLWCGNNYLISIELDENTNLVDLQIWNNQLDYLKLESNLNLKTLACEENNIDSLNLKMNTNLIILNCRNNDLEYLDIRDGNNINFIVMAADNNLNLTCIFVDDTTYAKNALNWYKDATAHYVETEQDCEALGVENYSAIDFIIYPNPVKDKLHFSSTQNLEKVILINLQGKELKTFSNLKKGELDFSSYSPGIYFLRIIKGGQSQIQKIIKL